MPTDRRVFGERKTRFWANGRPLSRKQKPGNLSLELCELTDSCLSSVAIRYNQLSVEHVRGLSKRQIMGYLVEVPMVFPLPHTNGREEESFLPLSYTYVVSIEKTQLSRRYCLSLWKEQWNMTERSHAASG
jgi:hypothetical protein